MTLPTYIFAFLIASVYGSLYHFVRGSGGWRLLLFLGSSILGFITGQMIGAWLGWYLFMMGAINLGMGTLGSILFLIGVEWLGRIEVNEESSV